MVAETATAAPVPPHPLGRKRPAQPRPCQPWPRRRTPDARRGRDASRQGEAARQRGRVTGLLVHPGVGLCLCLPPRFLSVETEARTGALQAVFERHCWVSPVSLAHWKAGCSPLSHCNEAGQNQPPGISLQRPAEAELGAIMREEWPDRRGLGRGGAVCQARPFATAPRPA